DALITTCDAPHKHYGILSSKQKVIPDKMIIVGPSKLVIEDVPTPLWLPFGFFPISKQRQQGILFPRDYEFSEQWGFGLRNLGYFIPLSEQMNLAITGDIYTRGTWGLTVQTDYVKNYRYNGNLMLGYYDRKNEILATGKKQHARSMQLRWQHTQDPKANPYRQLGGNINIQTNDAQRLNQNNASSVLENQFRSNMNWRQIFPDKPYTFSASFSHSQNTLSRLVTIDFPSTDFQMQRIYPFKKKKRIGEEKWYEKVGFLYNNSFRTRLETSDTTLFTKQALESIQMAMKHGTSTDASFRVMKYFNINPSVSYDEIWYFTRQNKRFDASSIVVGPDTIYNEDSTEFLIKQDTVGSGKILSARSFSFEPYRTLNANVGISTQIYGTLQFKKGRLKGLRHVIKPNVGFNYSPDYHSLYANTIDSVQSSIRPGVPYQRYSIFEGGVFGVAPSSGRQMALNYSFTNIFEAKYRGKKDSADRRIKLFDNIFVSGNYNFAADSLKWSPVAVRGTLRLFKDISNLQVSSAFDPYIVDSLNRRLNRFMINENGKLLRFDNLGLNLNTTFTVGKIKALFEKQEKGKTASDRADKGSGNPNDEDFVSIWENFNINHTLVAGWTTVKGKPEFDIRTNSLYMNGSIKLTRKWDIRVGNIGYDFISKQLTYPDFGFYRNLHCWEMGLNWQPQRATYSFYLRVRPSSLDFLSLPYRKNNQDAFNGY
ncbi:MAG: putative LPS assembly protein LptD, partial [Saprospiraceae bacterium]